MGMCYMQLIRKMENVRLFPWMPPMSFQGMAELRLTLLVISMCVEGD